MSANIKSIIYSCVCCIVACAFLFIFIAEVWACNNFLFGPDIGDKSFSAIQIVEKYGVYGSYPEERGLPEIDSSWSEAVSDYISFHRFEFQPTDTTTIIFYSSGCNLNPEMVCYSIVKNDTTKFVSLTFIASGSLIYHLTSFTACGKTFYPDELTVKARKVLDKKYEAILDQTIDHSEVLEEMEEARRKKEFLEKEEKNKPNQDSLFKCLEEK